MKGATTRVMSKKTRVRKRIFGVTSLILAVLVANIPVTSRALSGELFSSRIRARGENLSKAVTFLLNEDTTVGSNLHVNDPGTGSGSTYYDLTMVVNDAALVDTSTLSGAGALAKSLIEDHQVPNTDNPLNAPALSGYGYTAYDLFHLEYLGNYNHNGTSRVTGALPYLTAQQWSTTQLFFGIQGMREMLKDADYWQSGSPESGGTIDFDTKYGQKPRILFYRAEATDLNSLYDNDDTTNPTFSWVLMNDFATSVPTKSGEYYDIWEKVETDFRNWYMAVAYRELMKVSDGRDNAAADYPLGPVIASHEDHTLNSTHQLALSDITPNTVYGKSDLRYEIDNRQSTAGTTTLAYYECNVALLDNTNTPTTGTGSTVGISLPLPTALNYVQDGWELYIRDYDTVSDTGNVSQIAATQFDYVKLSTGNYAIQFEIDFDDSAVHTYDVGIALVKDNSGTIIPTPTQYNVRATSNNTTYGSFSTRVDSGTATSSASVNQTLEDTQTIIITAVPNSGYEFVRWDVATGTQPTLSTVNTTNDTVAVTVANADTTSRQVVLSAVFRDPSSPVNTPATLTVQASPAAYGSVSPNYTNQTGYYVGDSVLLNATASDPAQYQFLYWSWTDASGNQKTYQAPSFNYVIDNPAAVVTANFTEVNRPDYQLTIVDYRDKNYLKPLIYDSNGELITPDVEKKLGELYSNTVVRISDNATSMTAGHTQLLQSYLYAAPFHIDVDGTIRDSAGNYTISILDLPLPDNMDESKGKIGVVRLDFDAGGLASLPPVGNMSTNGKGYVSFDITKSGDYAFTYTIDPAKNEFHKLDQRRPKTAATSLDAVPDDMTTVDGDRTLIIENASSDVSDFADDLQTTLQNDGNVVYGGHVQYHLSLTGNIAQTNAAGVIVRDANGNPVFQEKEVSDLDEILLKLPVRTGYANSQIDVFRVKDDGNGTVTLLEQLNDEDVTITQIDGTTQLVTFTAYTPDYNADYIFLYQRKPALTVDETNREDKPAGEDTTARQTMPQQLPDDRFLIISTSRGDKITPLIRADSELKDYKIIAYDIRYVDSNGVDVTNFDTVRVELTVPESARNKYGLDLVSIKDNALEKQLIYENMVGNVYTFTTDHFSEYALVYLDEAPSPTQFTVSIGSITPTGSGTVTGQGSYDLNATATLSGNPATGYRFARWTDSSGNTLSTDNPWRFNVTGDRTVNAVFEPVNSGSTDTSGGSGTTGGSNTGTTGGSNTGTTGGGGTGTTGDSNTGGSNAGTGTTNTGTGTTNSGTDTTNSGTGTTVSSDGKTTNSTDMPKTGLDTMTVYKMIGVVLLVLFGSIEILSSLNTKKRRVATQS